MNANTISHSQPQEYWDLLCFLPNTTPALVHVQYASVQLGV